MQEAFPRGRHVRAAPKYPLQGRHLEPRFKGPTIQGFWTPAPGLQNPSGISGPARPPGFGQDPWPEPNSSSLSCQDAYRRSTCWAAPWAPNPHLMQLAGTGSARGWERHGYQSGGESDLAKNRTAGHPTTSRASSLTTRQSLSRNLQEAASAR